tara:strand:- start:4242 stop:6185 length:1944 start_codon:yes stop_codon:yes gene_type:complete
MLKLRKILSRGIPILLPAVFSALVILLSPLSIESGMGIAYAAGHSNWFWNGVTEFLLYIPAIFVQIANLIMAFGGLVFDGALRYTVVEFSSTFAFFEEGINAAWSGFRDIANIVMISMFVFVAFNVILNIKTYGTKKFVATILIVSVLINFSLFFTKAALDVSNILAIQFYNAISIESPSGSQGISTAFMQATGLAGGFIKGAHATLSEMSENGASVGDIIMYVIIVFFFAGAFAAVMAYGAILLITRMVVFIVLMLTSSLAFVAMMTPGLEEWWRKWKNALIKNVIFAPLFMIMLWATVSIIQNQGEREPLNLGKIIATDGAIEGILTTIMVLGLFYASTIVASNLSILGAGFAKNNAMRVLAASLTAPGFAVNSLFRLTGRNPAEALREQARRGADRMRTAGQFLGAGQKVDAYLQNLSESSMRLADSTAAQKLREKTGVRLGFESPTLEALADYEAARIKSGGSTRVDKQLQSITDELRNAASEQPGSSESIRQAAESDPATVVVQRDGEVESTAYTEMAERGQPGVDEQIQLAEQDRRIETARESTRQEPPLRDIPTADPAAASDTASRIRSVLELRDSISAKEKEFKTEKEFGSKARARSIREEIRALEELRDAAVDATYASGRVSPRRKAFAERIKNQLKE